MLKTLNLDSGYSSVIVMVTTHMCTYCKYISVQTVTVVTTVTVVHVHVFTTCAFLSKQ